jgi:hypothetical protein
MFAQTPCSGVQGWICRAYSPGSEGPARSRSTCLSLSKWSGPRSWLRAPVLERVGDRGEDRGDNGPDAFFAPRRDRRGGRGPWRELALRAGRSPGAVIDGCFNQRGPLAHAGGSALAGAFVAVGKEAGASDQVAGGGEPAPVDVDFGDDDLCPRSTNAWFVLKILSAARKGSMLAATSLV